MQTVRHKRNAYASACPTRLVLDRVADKWAVLILGLLGDGPVKIQPDTPPDRGHFAKGIVPDPEKPGA